jgi:hypothetical protein
MTTLILSRRESSKFLLKTTICLAKESLSVFQLETLWTQLKQLKTQSSRVSCDGNKVSQRIFDELFVTILRSSRLLGNDENMGKCNMFVCEVS